MKRIVLIAFDCNPNGESESLEAWEMAKSLSEFYDVTVITRPYAKWDISNEINKLCLKSLKFIYVDCLKIKKKYEKSKGIFKLLILSKYVDNFFKLVHSQLLILENEKHIDVIHKITPNSYRKIINLSDFKASIKIFGPCGGAQETPKELYTFLNVFEKVQEICHKMINKMVQTSRKYKQAINSYDIIFSTNIETKKAIERICQPNKVFLMSDVGTTDVVPRHDFLPSDKLNILFIGRLMYRKGINLILDVMNECNCNATLTFVGAGKKDKYIKKYVSRHKLEDKIQTIGRIDHSKTKDFYLKSDLLFFPSFRESSGNVFIESIASGTPVLTFSFAGGYEILGKAGIFVEINNKSHKDIVSKFKMMIEQCLEDRHFLETKSVQSIKRARQFTWAKKAEEMRNFYEKYLG